jgi:hypothetical protein
VLSEFAVDVGLVGLIGLFFIYAGHFHHDRRHADATELTVTVPIWLRSMLRSGPGPVRLVSAAFEVYGAGMLVLSALWVVLGSDSAMASRALGAWLLVGLLLIFVLNVVSSVLGRRQPGNDARP